MTERGASAFRTAFLRAIRLHQRGRLGEAVEAYEQAIRLDASVPDAHNNLGCALLALGRLDDAALALERALVLRPAYPAALDNLGVVRTQLEQHARALELYERATALEPADATFRTHLGLALVAAQRYREAQACFEAALALAPQDAAARNGRGIVLDRLGRADEAEMEFRAALALDPNHAGAACNLGCSLLQSGDVASASALFGRAVQLEPSNARHHFYLVLSRSGALDDAELERTERLARDAEPLPPTRRIELHFALAAVYEQRGRDDEAFAELRAGNARKRATIAYDEGAMLRSAAMLEQTYTAPSLAAQRDCGNPSARPIFIVGMPRSGTTLVEQLFAAHPAVAAGGELPAFDRLARALVPAMDSGLPSSELAAHIRRCGDDYLRATDAAAGDAARLTDKMPGNFWYAPLVHLALPNARLIHVRRDRLDTCVSCFATLFVEQSVPYAYDLGELGRYHRAYERAMAAWRTLLPAERFIELDYERLVDDLEGEARRLLAFCGLPWDGAVLEFQRAPRRVQTASNVQVRRPLYRSAIGRSRRFAAHLGPLVAALTDASDP